MATTASRPTSCRRLTPARDFPIGVDEPLLNRHSPAVADQDTERFGRAVANNVRAGLGGVAVGLPVVLLAAFEASSGVMVAYLVAVTIVLAVVVVRRRLPRRG